MKQQVLFLTCILVFVLISSTSLDAQNIAINSDGSAPDSSAMLDIKAENMGLLIPRITEANRPSDPATGLLIYQTNGEKGFYYYDGTGWQKVGSIEELTALIDVESAARKVADITQQVNINNEATTRTAADITLQTNIDTEESARQAADSALHTELDTTQSGAGLATDGSYTANAAANYIKLATSLTDADNILDTQVKSNTDNISTNVGNIASNTGKFGTAGTVEASKAVVVDTGRNIINFNNIQVDGTITSGSSIVIDGTGSTQGSITESHGKISFGDEMLVTTGIVGVGTASPEASAILEATSTSKGFLPPRMTTVQRDAIISPVEGLVIYNTSNKALEVFTGTFWGSVTGEFICRNQFLDSEGNVYNTVKIGSQCWMAENLNIGTRINGNIDQSNNGTIEKYCSFNIETNCDVYGGLYQWNEIMQYSTTEGVQGICPTGWYLPTDAEWITLTTYISSRPEYLCNSNANNIAKALAATTNWDADTNTCAVGNNLAANNASGFTALPGGYRGTSGNFINLSNGGYWWSSTEYSSTYVWLRVLRYYNADVGLGRNTKEYGFSVRCVRDE